MNFKTNKNRFKADSIIDHLTQVDLRLMLDVESNDDKVHRYLASETSYRRAQSKGIRTGIDKLNFDLFDHQNWLEKLPDAEQFDFSKTLLSSSEVREFKRKIKSRKVELSKLNNFLNELVVLLDSGKSSAELVKEIKRLMQDISTLKTENVELLGVLRSISQIQTPKGSDRIVAISFGLKFFFSALKAVVKKGNKRVLASDSMNLIITEKSESKFQSAAPVKEKPKKKKEKEKKPKKKVTEFYITDTNDVEQEKYKVGDTIVLHVKTENRIGDKMTISLEDKTHDFKYKGEVLENDSITDYEVKSDHERIELEVVSETSQDENEGKPYDADYTEIGTSKPCFLAGTIVKTPEGDKVIEDLAVGDSVFAWDIKGEKIAEKKVVRCYNNWTNKYYEIFTIESKPIFSTEKHLFWISEVGKWIPAKDLKRGQMLLDREGSLKEIIDIRLVENVELSTYNMEIEDFHNYFVGDFGVLVHNDKKPSIFESTETHDVEFYMVLDDQDNIVYIGQTRQGVDAREAQHIAEGKKKGSFKEEWSNKEKFRFETIDIDKKGPLTPYEAHVWEKHLIEKAMDEGNILKNSANPIGKKKFDNFKDLHKPC